MGEGRLKDRGTRKIKGRGYKTSEGVSLRGGSVGRLREGGTRKTEGRGLQGFLGGVG